MFSIKLEQSMSNNSAVIEKEPAELKNKSPKYKVLLHNDPVNSMEYVTISLREGVPQLSEQDAISIMLEAHNTGVGLVIVCDLEPAEFYSESLKSWNLNGNNNNYILIILSIASITFDLELNADKRK